MSELIGIVARAQYEHAFGPEQFYAPELWENLPPEAREPWFAAARAALIAIRDNLTDSMAEVIAHHGRCCGGIAQTLWSDAIDVELKDSSHAP